MHIQFSDYAFKIRETDGKQVIFDSFRKKWVVLTPEEWVRQHVLHYLQDDHGYPASMISVEKKVRVLGSLRRTDIVLYSRTMQPVLIVECKAGDVRIDEKVFAQIARYNLTLKVPYLWVSNGNVNYLSKIDHKNQKYSFLPALPAKEELLSL